MLSKFELTQSRRPFWITLLVVSVAVIWTLWQNIELVAPPGLTRVSYLDVGQGDAIYINTQAGHRLLIDGGPGQAVVGQVTGRLPVFDNTLDAVFLTHGDADHLSGLVPLLSAVPVRAVFTTLVGRATQKYEDFLLTLEEKKIPVYRLAQGATLNFGEAKFEVVSPGGALANRILPKVNNTSLVILMTVGERKFLFTGDIESPIEQQIITRNSGLVDVLKVAHHGSKTSSSLEFLNAIQPALAVFEVGAGNTYGHPAPEVLARYKESRIWRTDQDGEINMFTDGQNIFVKAVADYFYHGARGSPPTPCFARLRKGRLPPHLSLPP